MEITKDNFEAICERVEEFFSNGSSYYWYGKSQKIKMEDKRKGEFLVYFNEIDDILYCVIVDTLTEILWWIPHERRENDKNCIIDISFENDKILLKEINGEQEIAYTCFQSINLPEKVYKFVDIVKKHYNDTRGERFERIINGLFQKYLVEDEKFSYEVWETFENPSVSIRALSISWIENEKIQNIVDTIYID